MKIKKLIELMHGINKADFYSSWSHNSGNINSTTRETYWSSIWISNLGLGPKRENIEVEWSASQDILYRPKLRKKSNDTLVTVTGYYIEDGGSGSDRTIL